MQFSMHLFLPNERDGLPKLLEEFSDSPSLKLDVSVRYLDQFMIPKFKFSYGFGVSDLINGLGVRYGWAYRDDRAS